MTVRLSGWLACRLTGWLSGCLKECDARIFSRDAEIFRQKAIKVKVKFVYHFESSEPKQRSVSQAFITLRPRTLGGVWISVTVLDFLSSEEVLLLLL